MIVISKRWLPWVTGLVAGVFLAIALPGSPVARWVGDVLLGSRGKIAVNGVRPLPAAEEPREPRPLRAAVAAMISPQRTFLNYRHLFEILARELGRPLVFVQRRTYGEINQLLEAGDLDLAWVCTGALEDLQAHGGVDLVAVPVVGGRAEYRAYVIAQDPGPVRSLEDLRGREFAFTDPLSLTGRKVVVEWLARRGTTPEAFFGGTFFTHAHDNSIRAVRRGLAAGASVDSLVYGWLRRVAPAEVSGTRVVWRSEWFPIPPLVAPKRLDPVALRKIRGVLLGMGRDPRTRKILARIGMERFEIPDPSVYLRR